MKVKFGGLKRVTSKTFDKLSAEDLTNSIVFIEDTGTVYVNGVLYGSSIDISSLAKQGENQEATNSKILEGINSIFNKFDGQYAEQLNEIIG